MQAAAPTPLLASPVMAAQPGLIEQAHVTALIRNSEFLHTHLEDKVKDLLPGLVDASVLTVKKKKPN